MRIYNQNDKPFETCNVFSYQRAHLHEYQELCIGNNWGTTGSRSMRIVTKVKNGVPGYERLQTDPSQPEE